MHRAEVKIVAHSMSHTHIPLISYQLRYWRPIHSELMTHRVFSRNAGSSRARPSAGIIEQVKNDPWGPLHWGANQPGMQAATELDQHDRDLVHSTWLHAAQVAASTAKEMLHLGAHKQIVNRVLEPYTFIDVLVTSTQFANWFALRNHPDAQPEIQDLAAQMQEALNNSTPKILLPGEWHLPYISDLDWTEAYWHLKNKRITRDEPSHEEISKLLCKVSTARCARISYSLFDGSTATIEKDLDLYEKLVGGSPLHASPAEHQATPDEMDEHGNFLNPKLHGNLQGYRQYRKYLPYEFVPG